MWFIGLSPDASTHARALDLTRTHTYTETQIHTYTQTQTQTDTHPLTPTLNQVSNIHPLPLAVRDRVANVDLRAREGTGAEARAAVEVVTFLLLKMLRTGRIWR